MLLCRDFSKTIADITFAAGNETPEMVINDGSRVYIFQSISIGGPTESWNWLLTQLTNGSISPTKAGYAVGDGKVTYYKRVTADASS